VVDEGERGGQARERRGGEEEGGEEEERERDKEVWWSGRAWGDVIVTWSLISRAAGTPPHGALPSWSSGSPRRGTSRSLCTLTEGACLGPAAMGWVSLGRRQLARAAWASRAGAGVSAGVRARRWLPPWAVQALSTSGGRGGRAASGGGVGGGSGPGSEAKDDVPVAYDLSVVKSLQDLSAMFQHWANVKKDHPDKLLLYRVGDFYECYFNDAVTLANVCNFAVTSKLCGTRVGYKAAMSGLPMHSVEKHIPKLLQEGYVVAVVEQLEEAGTPGIGSRNLERGIIDILTPGTVTDAEYMPGSTADGGKTRGNNYLAAIMPGSALAPGHAGRWGLAVADVSTGEVFCTDCHSGGNTSLAEELQRLQPAEVLVPANLRHQGRGDLVGGGRGSAAEARAESVVDSIYKSAAAGRGGGYGGPLGGGESAVDGGGQITVSLDEALELAAAECEENYHHDRDGGERGAELAKWRGSPGTDSIGEIPEAVSLPTGLNYTLRPMWNFARRERCEGKILGRFNLQSLEPLGLHEPRRRLAVMALGGLLDYLEQTRELNITAYPTGSAAGAEVTSFVAPEGSALGSSSLPLQVPRFYSIHDYMNVDAAARANLELMRTLRTGTTKGSLLHEMDKCRTKMGSRTLSRWLTQPLLDVDAIGERQDCVAAFCEDDLARDRCARVLEGIDDLERLAGVAAWQRGGAAQGIAALETSPLASASIGPAELLRLAEGLLAAPRLGELLPRGSSEATLALFDLPGLRGLSPELQAMADEVKATIVASPPLRLSDGGFIRERVDVDVDIRWAAVRDCDRRLKELVEEEKQTSGASSLRLGHGPKSGYFLQVSGREDGQKLAKNPRYRKAASVGSGLRFSTDALQALESERIGCKTAACKAELACYASLRRRVSAVVSPVREVASSLATIDVLLALADAARERGYVRPRVIAKEGDTAMQVRGARHPVIEASLRRKAKQFVPNDVSLGGGVREAPSLLVLTGANASGKSVYLRMIGLLQIMAQVGSFVPADSAVFPVRDAVFVRAGAVDDLGSGQSTFMVEMSETSSILRQATHRSLVLMDEIGRGTATSDGVSIAWAVAEHLCVTRRSTTIFATHYKEVTHLEGAMPAGRARNAHFDAAKTVADGDGALAFDHVLRDGPAATSHGIDAAAMAGLPPAVVARARTLYARIEEAEAGVTDGLRWGALAAEDAAEEAAGLDLGSLGSLDSVWAAALNNMRTSSTRALVSQHGTLLGVAGLAAHDSGGRPASVRVGITSPGWLPSFTSPPGNANPRVSELTAAFEAVLKRPVVVHVQLAHAED